jgi:D-sedoheptulose 7-phosphate isomerase
METIAKNYITDLQTHLSTFPTAKLVTLTKLIKKTLATNKKILIAGNGGSASLASHLCADLQKTILESDYSTKKRLQVFSLTDNIPLLTAWANDYGYEHVFSQQLVNIGEAGDLLLVISGSGNSKNIVNALSMAKTKKLTTFGLFGFKGGSALSMVDDYILIESDRYGVIEDMHCIIAHMLTEILKNYAKWKA